MKKFLVSLLLSGMLLFSNSVFASDWVRVATNDDETVSFFIDVDSVRVDDEKTVATLWLMSMDEKKRLYVKTFTYLDLEKGMNYCYKKLMIYSMDTNKLLRNKDFSDDQIPCSKVIPNSLMDEVVKYLNVSIKNQSL